MGVIRWGLRLSLVGLIVYLLTCVAVIYENARMIETYGNELSGDPPVKVAIVLAGGLTSKGTISHSSRQRAQRAVAVLNGRGADWLIFSGSIEYGGDQQSTAELMREYAVAAGVPIEKTIVEPDSGTTFESLRISLAIAEQLGAAPDGHDIVIVTDGTHLTRSWMLAAYFCCAAVQLAASDSFSAYKTRGRVIVVTREAAAWWYNLGKVALWEALGRLGVPPEERARFVN